MTDFPRVFDRRPHRYCSVGGCWNRQGAGRYCGLHQAVADRCGSWVGAILAGLVGFAVAWKVLR